MTYLIIFRGHRGPRKKNFLCSKFSYVSDANFNLTYFISFRGPGLDPEFILNFFISTWLTQSPLFEFLRVFNSGIFNSENLRVFWYHIIFLLKNFFFSKFRYNFITMSFEDKSKSVKDDDGKNILILQKFIYDWGPIQINILQ